MGKARSFEWDERSRISPLGYQRILCTSMPGKYQFIINQQRAGLCRGHSAQRLINQRGTHPRRLGVITNKLGDQIHATQPLNHPTTYLYTVFIYMYLLLLLLLPLLLLLLLLYIYTFILSKNIILSFYIYI